MSRTVIDILWLELASPTEGHKRLRSVMEVSINDTDPAAETVKTITPERKAIGHKGGISDFELEFKAVRLLPAEVDWLGLKRRRELVQVYYQEAAGTVPGDRYKAEDCRITEVSATGNAEGEAELTIKLVPLDHRKED